VRLKATGEANYYLKLHKNTVAELVKIIVDGGFDTVVLNWEFIALAGVLRKELASLAPADEFAGANLGPVYTGKGEGGLPFPADAGSKPEGFITAARAEARTLPAMDELAPLAPADEFAAANLGPAFAGKGEADVYTGKENVSLIGWLHNDAALALENPAHMRKYRSDFLNALGSLDELVVLTRDDVPVLQPYVTKPVKVIHNPIDASWFGEGGAEQLAGTSVSDTVGARQVRIAFSGRLDFDQKGVSELIQLAVALPDDYIIAYAGGGTDPSDPDVKRFWAEVDAAGVRGKFDYCGKLNDAELKAFYDSCSAYVTVSKYEGLQNTVGEAMVRGLPVVAFEQTSSREWLCEERSDEVHYAQTGSHTVSNRDGFGILVRQGDIESMANELVALHEDPALHEEFARRSNKRARAFHPSKIIKQWEDLGSPSYNVS
jgi:glycosyltransferase involved in cell wall biosynthesis